MLLFQQHAVAEPSWVLAACWCLLLIAAYWCFLQDFTKDERKQLAVKSRTEVPKFGSAARQKVINDMHQRMLELQQQAPASSSSSSSPSKVKEAAPAGPPTSAVAPLGRTVSIDATPTGARDSDQDTNKQQQVQQQQEVLQPQVVQQGQQPAPEVQQQQTSSSVQVSPSSNSNSSMQSVTKQPAAVQYQQASPPNQLQLQRAAMVAAGSRPGDLGDKGLTFLALVLSVAIAAMLLKKVMTAMGGYRLFVEM